MRKMIIENESIKREKDEKEEGGARYHVRKKYRLTVVCR
jgi:hypothetical protein